jgi:hypothetical protein
MTNFSDDTEDPLQGHWAWILAAGVILAAVVGLCIFFGAK